MAIRNGVFEVLVCADDELDSFLTEHFITFELLIRESVVPWMGVEGFTAFLLYAFFVDKISGEVSGKVGCERTVLFEMVGPPDVVDMLRKKGSNESRVRREEKDRLRGNMR